jgi:YggT family protein
VGETVNLFWAYWPYQVPNYLLSALFWTCLGRFILGLFFPPGHPNYIWRNFCRLTDWLLALVRPITPGFVLEAFLPLVAGFWVLVARYVFYVVMRAAGLVPPLGNMVSG